jgi:hypothetical protein
MASLATSAATQILLQARGELKGEQGLAGQRH